MKITTNYAIRINKPVFKSKKITPKQTASLIVSSSAMVAGCARILTEGNMETKKFTKLKEELSQKLEPATLDAKKADWDFYTNSTDENLKKSKTASDKIDAIFHNEETYNKFLQIDKTKLSKHDSKQLKDILKAFDDELNTGEAKKALRDKENEIAQKYNSYVPTLDGKEVTRLELSRITEQEADPEIRKKAYEAKIKGGDLIAEDLKEFAKMRNEYAKTKGFETYFDYMIKDSYNKVLQEEDYSRDKKENKVMNAIAPAYWLLVTAGYLTWSFVSRDWGFTWIVWPIAGIIFGAIAAVAEQVTK